MQYKKKCNSCGKHVDEGYEPYIQIHGSVSEQYKDEDTDKVYYRYLTEEPKSRLVFCNHYCLIEWIYERGETVQYIPRSYPQ